jgi:hypothetical protein
VCLRTWVLGVSGGHFVCGGSLMVGCGGGGGGRGWRGAECEVEHKLVR